MSASILVTNADIAAPALAMLEERQARATFVPISTMADELTALLAREPFDAVISRSVQITAEAIAGAAKLRVISKYGAGVDNIDVDAATKRGIPVMVARAANAQSVAEHAFALLLALVKRVIALDRSLRQGQWVKAGHMVSELAGQHLGLVGFGSVGRAVAPIARGFGMAVSVYDPYVPSTAIPTGIRLQQRLDDLLVEADVVSLHCPLSRETRGMFDRDRLRRMKPTAYLLNTARGPIVDEAALIEGLKNGTIAGAGIDCFTDEPPAAGSPLLALNNVVMTPHVAGSTVEAFDRVAVASVENVFAILDGKTPNAACLVNPAALKTKG
jgi:D-3-phosphoglycerate dehydrogenase